MRLTVVEVSYFASFFRRVGGCMTAYNPFGVAFDLEGTVVDVEAAHHYAHLRLCREVGLIFSLETARAQIPHFIGGPDRAICEDILALLDPCVACDLSVEYLLSLDTSYYEEELSSIDIVARRGFVDFCMIAHKLGASLSIGSLTSRTRALDLMRRAGIASLFANYCCVFAEDVVHLKPHPDVFLATAERMGVSPARQIVFEDSSRGIQAARAAGSHAVGMPVIIASDTVASLVQAGACRLFFQWDEIRPDRLFANLLQLNF